MARDVYARDYHILVLNKYMIYLELTGQNIQVMTFSIGYKAKLASYLAKVTSLNNLTASKLLIPF